MADEIDRKLLDRRVAQRYLKKGVLDEKEYEKYLKGLPDLAEQAVPVESDLEASADLGIDDDDEDEGEEDEGSEPPPQGGNGVPGAEQKGP
jgi:hypothetical protein